jgi:succinate dehydrogenase / fumarate reductase flavoprotein subunit
MRSHTGAAQGGIGAALGNTDIDNPEWHAFDTIKGGDYLVDQQAAKTLAEEAVQAVYDLENRGLPFSRTEEGKIAQRRFGGHTSNFGEAPVRRSCYAADRTGHMILQTLYQQCIKNDVHFFDEFQAVELVMEGNKATGLVVFELSTGEVHLFKAKAILFATGGFGRMFKITSNAHANTGDGPALVARAGIPLEDMEFFQFHPTGIRGMGILITEGVRGEGGILRNNSGERFMERYAPTMLDLAPRDMVSRAMLSEILEGRGMRGDRQIDDYLMLDASLLGKDVVYQKIPDIADFCKTYLAIDPAEAPMPVQPTAHYAMGGIPTNIHGQVCTEDTVYEGLYAAGEAACVSVHGANRLGTNSLVDLVVYGRRAGQHIADYVRHADQGPVTERATEPFKEWVSRLKNRKGKHPGPVYERMQELMMEKVGVYREESPLKDAVAELQRLRDEMREISVEDSNVGFNQETLNILELENLIDLSLVTATSALNRTESRGAHFRNDFPDRDDDTWLTHSLAYLNGKDVKIGYKSVDTSIWEPKPRKY